MLEMCAKLKLKTPELCQWHSSGFLISNFKHISLSISKCLLGTFRYNYIFLRYNCFVIYCGNFKFRSSHRRCSVRKGVLRNSEKFTGKHLFHSQRKTCNFIKMESLAQVFPMNFASFSEHLIQRTSPDNWFCPMFWILSLKFTDLFKGVQKEDTWQKCVTN